MKRSVIGCLILCWYSLGTAWCPSVRAGEPSTIRTGVEHAADPVGMTLQGAMIWDAGDKASPTSVAFRKTITLAGKPASATMHIFADARYMLWINGNYVARGPNRFDPKRPEYDTLQIGDYLHAGVNTLAVLVHSRLSNVKLSMPPAPGGKPGQTGTRSREPAA